ncbi:hypothetical protein COY43_01100 [Candidatus Berkelbacteria bacterium CG_4_10_14_0_8_um_filter_35_9_33_8]|uniref:Uncharacterized protein n=1 Tax=Candidatus Berkelbacteria bacterium CG_4_10_14_0_2_um_filter_35_9_33_12 TaxID=1974499 RepID=A0A2M7W4W8_9BACT|nr:MAG: hypothetical protein COX10_00015 [Candidatus Berkelbacteria bacterium CG23_combo_of_CG06-09_8_20_14_all_33_15]PIZ28318.1 MAG: hypothetical protein COY43_01100 [Candidatus Berkelbacteria bacterium CG_4_10_14_0_8_um_filter_35_9_33_8]PJA21001.1 MAG: hypothetical protein COX60_00085 [Candidatus Berkelbacteria bacterium CG_4_10_14_0_2_um_filter_35_9_33_12]
MFEIEKKELIEFEAMLFEQLSPTESIVLTKIILHPDYLMSTEEQALINECEIDFPDTINIDEIPKFIYENTELFSKIKIASRKKLEGQSTRLFEESVVNKIASSIEGSDNEIQFDGLDRVSISLKPEKILEKIIGLRQCNNHLRSYIKP